MIRIITTEYLLQHANEIVETIDKEKVIYITKDKNIGEHVVVGPSEICGRVLGLVDAEYGWPEFITETELRADPSKIIPKGHHPFIRSDETRKSLANAIGGSEFEGVVQRLEKRYKADKDSVPESYVRLRETILNK